MEKFNLINKTVIFALSATVATASIARLMITFLQ